MKKKFLLIIIIFILIFIGVYFAFNNFTYNNIVKIEANVTSKVTLTDKEEIKVFMKALNTKKRIKEPVSILNPNDVPIENNVIIHYKNGTNTSLLMMMDYTNKELTCQSDEYSSTGYTINQANIENILELFQK